MTPSTKGVMEDIADISLESRDRFDRDVSATSDKSSDHLEQPKVPGAVLVTTTIQRESKPGGIDFDSMSMGEGYTGRGMSRPISGTAAFLRTSQTKITAGTHR